jgi:hypothetical protein
LIDEYLFRKTYADEISKFGIDAKDVGIAIDDFAGNLKYKYDGAFSGINVWWNCAYHSSIVEAIEQFAKDYVDGKLEPYIKSAPLPESNDEGVKVVVGKNFKDIVL